MSSGGAFQYSRAGGVYVPAGWGDLWRAARAQAGQRRVNVMAWGDSIFAGYYTSDFRSKSPSTALFASLRARYGDGGSGVQLATDLTGIVFAVNGATYGAITGAWTIFYGGFAECYVNNNVAAVGTLQWPTVRGSVIDVWIMPNIGAVSTIEIRIDGVLVDTANLPQTAGPSQRRTYNVADGTHVVLLTVTAGRPGIHAVRGSRPTGIAGHNIAVAGRDSTKGGDTALTPGAVTSAAYTTSEVAPDLLLVELGVNDVNVQTTEAAFLSNVQRIVAPARAQATPAEVVLVTAHFGNTADPNFFATRYARAMKAVAETMGCAWVNFWADGHASYADWAAKGYWGVTNGVAGAAGADGVHLSDAGAAHMADALGRLLLG